MNKYILDTCVLINLKSKKTGQAVANALEKIKGEYFVSDCSRFEYLRSFKDINELNQKESFVNKFATFQLDENTILIGTYYYNLISKFKKTGSKSLLLSMKQFSDVDILIAATSIAKGTFICTFDGADYPRPFFSEKQIIRIEPSHKLFVLEPDLDCFKSALDDMGIEVISKS